MGGKNQTVSGFFFRRDHVDHRRTNAVGAANLSPSLQRWGVQEFVASAVGTAQFVARVPSLRDSGFLRTSTQRWSAGLRFFAPLAGLAPLRVARQCAWSCVVGCCFQPPCLSLLTTPIISHIPAQYTSTAKVSSGPVNRCRQCRWSRRLGSCS